MEKLESLLNELETAFAHRQQLNALVSKAPVGWHVAHSLITLNLIVKAIADSKPEKYKSKFSFAKLYVFALQKIPRGRIQSPASVRPAENFTDEFIKEQFDEAYRSVQKLSGFEKNKFFSHPFFGHLNRKPAIRFLEIHTKHHLHIINDILKAQKV